MQRVLGTVLLGERIVVARIGGQVVAMHGTCPHRGAALEVGWLSPDGEAVTCRYHGFEWSASGRIRRIPALEVAGHALPTGSGWCVQTYQCEVRYGLVWVCMDPSPRAPIMELPEAVDQAYVASPIFESDWAAGVGRIIEASLDTYHFAFTHWGSIGDPSRPEAPRTRVTSDDEVFSIEYDIEQPRTRSVTYRDEHASEPDAYLRSHYRFSALPNAIHMLKSNPAVRFGTLLAVKPVSAERSVVYRRLYTAGDWPVDLSEFYATQTRVNEEDRVVIESQRPSELVTDLDAELQAYVDRPTVAFRRWLAARGIRAL